MRLILNQDGATKVGRGEEEAGAAAEGSSGTVSETGQYYFDIYFRAVWEKT